MVNIHLNVDGSPLFFLTIPKSEVLRLSIRPYKWMRYVMFSICGARGDISMAPNGQPVDYDSTTLADFIVLYYNPSERCLFVDYEAFNDRITSSDSFQTPYHSSRQDIVNRDGGCVVTLEDEDECDAAHLIPASKGDEYIHRVVRDRSPLYESLPSISEIDAIENGVLLSSDLRKRLGNGQAAFLKTPNYGLEPTDIPRYEQSPTRGTDHITHHQLQVLSNYRDHQNAVVSTASHPCTAYIFGAHVDAQFRSSEQGALLPLPPAIILDYMYGVAAYKCWRSDPESVPDVMSTYHREHYADIPPPPRRIPTTASQNEVEDEVVQAMDELNVF